MSGVPRRRPGGYPSSEAGTRQSKAAGRGKRISERSAKVTSCKTCTFCRSRKTRCDGSRPQCSSCIAAGHTCAYPEDARRVHRPTRADVEALEAQIASLRELVQQNSTSHNATDKHFGNSSSIGTGSSLPTHAGQDVYEINISPDHYSLESPQASSQQISESYALLTPTDNSTRVSSPYPVEESIEKSNGPRKFMGTEAEADIDAGPSPSEVDVAGVSRHNGDLVVHGVSSMFHQLGYTHRTSSTSTSASTAERKHQNQISKARLIANAALLRQRENVILRNPDLNKNINFDGVNPDLAIHLLDLHWNRQHYTYLISYRPAIMDSLMSDGPYVNGLLLNAIYFSSSLLSDRAEVLSDPMGPQSAGARFYNRFRVLLMDYIDKPSIPSSVALLLCGAALVSHGRPSAGWIMSGIAYRMIIDLGCHLVLDSRRCDGNSQMALLTDVELEMRKRLYWGAFLTDVTQSLYFGRPPCLRTSQARVPQLLLDTFEELEDWTPYIDPLLPSGLPSYAPRPAYAISTVNAMVRLFGIASKIIHSFYSIKSLKESPQHIRNIKSAVEAELDQWITTIPPHLEFNPEADGSPPPHQVTPFTTYHTLRILLQRPFMENGHLRQDLQYRDREAGEHICVDAALAIWRLVKAYKTAFTLRRAPYIICYSIYSAVVAILNQRSFEQSHFTECIRFFWSALIDLQRGCNFGLQKPLDILKDIVAQFGKDIPRSTDQAGHGVRDVVDLDKSFEITYMNASAEYRSDPSNTRKIMADFPQRDPFSSWDPGEIGLNADGEDWFVNDTLYGLFTTNSY